MEEEIPLNELYKCMMHQKQERAFCGIRYKHLTWWWPVIPVLSLHVQFVEQSAGVQWRAWLCPLRKKVGSPCAVFECTRAGG